MTTIDEMKSMISESGRNGVWMKTSPDDVFTKYWKYESAIDDLPVDLRDDVCGWEKCSIGYKPVFATKQSVWDKWYEEFTERKSSWCEKNGCE